MGTSSSSWVGGVEQLYGGKNNGVNTGFGGGAGYYLADAATSANGFFGAEA